MNECKHLYSSKYLELQFENVHETRFLMLMFRRESVSELYWPNRFLRVQSKFLCKNLLKWH